jgi:uncharacterized protein involved in response to NO
VTPYRVLFPIGWTYGVMGAGLWPLHALGGVPYPGAAHRLLMIQGFEQCFVLGFLLTAMPGFTKGAPCHPVELALAVAAALAFGVAVLLGAYPAAALAYLVSVLVLVAAVGRRMGPSQHARPMELLFVGFGLATGLVGAVRLAAAGGIDPFASRMLSLGMVLSLVLGLGGLLVPTFTGMRAPLVIPGVAGAHERRGRLPLYLLLILGLASAFVLEALGRPDAGAYVRAAAATALVLLVWKLYRPPGRRDAPAIALWGSGWLVLAGLWLAALAPVRTVAALHLVFLGGFALLTLGVGTRVVVAHGRHALAEERRVLTPMIVVVMLLALVARLAAEWMPAQATLLLGVSGGLWIAGWSAWALGALPRIARLGPPARTSPTPP